MFVRTLDRKVLSHFSYFSKGRYVSYIGILTPHKLPKHFPNCLAPCNRRKKKTVLSSEHKVSNTFLFNKTNRRTNFPNLFCQETLHFSRQFLCPSSGVFHRTLGTGTCQAGLMTAFKHEPDRAWKLSSNLHDIYQCRMYSGKLLMMGRGTARKHVEFLDKNKFGKLVRLFVLLKINLLRCTVTWT